MKGLLLFLLMPVYVFSQNAEERQKIIASYDKKEVTQLKEYSKTQALEQKKLIDDYKSKNFFKESETYSLQRIYNGIPIFFTTSNDGSSKTIKTNLLYPGGTLGLSVTGAGITAGVWDGGKVRNTHLEFQTGRVTPNDDASTLSVHATHVTGTIVARGANPARRGIAYEAKALTHDWDNDYDEMVSFGSLGYLVSNHSYGYASASLPVWLFGQYDASSREIDMLSNAYPFYQIVIAAGNDRDQSFAHVTENGGYDLLSGTGTSKNGITVAAVNELLNYTGAGSVVMSDFSNYGPTDDGRIKPDIAAKGVGVFSTVSNSDTSYGILNGTSMAAPAITGMIVLLQKHYNNLNASYMKAATVRGLICHSANEAGVFPGPDYEFGWGLANAEEAAKIISAKGTTAILEENNLPNTQTFTKNISISSPQKLQVTICWTDPIGALNTNGVLNNRVPRLRNNLDLKILKDGVTYYPWKMNPDDQFAAATRDSDNNVDNVEKVEIDMAQPGTYTIQVTHKGNLVTSSQDFSLIASSTNGVTLNRDNFIADNSIVVYPNPVANNLNFSIANDIVLSDISIFDITGKLVISSKDFSSNSVNVSNLQSGVYFAKFSSQDKTVTRKFIKQ
ncbi:C5a peptidase precursor [compost metagenome]